MPLAAIGPVRLEFNGGGGGSRTPVRKHSILASTYLARFVIFVPGVSIGQNCHGTNLF